MASKSKEMKFSIGEDQVMYSNISKSKDGYNSARVVAKINDKEYMSVSYEWEGNAVPDFAMNLMGFMQASKLEVGVVVEAHADEYEEFAAKKKANPFTKKKDDDEEMDDDEKKNKNRKRNIQIDDGYQHFNCCSNSSTRYWICHISRYWFNRY